MLKRTLMLLAVLAASAPAFGARAADSATAERATTKPVPRDKEKWWTDRHDKVNEQAKKGDAELIFLGDSITHGWEGNKELWEKYFGKYKPINAGFSGDRTQHVLWRIEHGEIDGIKPKLAVIMIGTNNAGSDKPEDTAEGVKAIVEKLPAANFGIGGDRTQHVLWRITNGELEGIGPKVVVLMLGTNNIKSDSPRAIARADEKIVRTIQQKLPATKVLLLGIFPRAHRTDAPEMQIPAKVKAVNTELARLDDGKGVRYLDLADRFAPDGALVADYYTDKVHLTAKGYEAWADAIDARLKEMME